MISELRAGYELLRRRARLVRRQIALAVALTVLAVAFMASALYEAPSKKIDGSLGAFMVVK